MRRLFVGIAAAAMWAAAGGAEAACYDLSKSEPHSLTGVLSHRIFPGSPGFSDVRRGDEPEPGWLLQLAAPICLSGDEFADPGRMFSEAQLIETDATAAALRAANGKLVMVQLADPIPAMTGHHHRPLVATVTNVIEAGDITGEYGTAATVVRAFYAALAAGDGEEAANFVVPERRRGPFAPDQMTRFYGGLLSPLKLLSLEPAGPDVWLARYQFVSRAGACQGRARVRTILRGGLNLIDAIQALDNC